MSTEAKTENLPAISTIKLNSEGRFMPNSFEDSFRLARMYVASGMLPKRFTTPESVVTAQQYAAELGIQGITALRQIAVVNGTPALFGDLPLAVVRSRGHFESIDEYLVTADGTRICLENKNIDQPFFAAVCTVKRKGEKAHTVIFSEADARTAGIWGQNVWKVYPKRMIQMRARGQALKDVFPDSLSGIAQGEYDLDTTIEKVVESEVHGMPQGAAKLNGLVKRDDALAVTPISPVTLEQPRTPEVLPPETAAKGAQSDFESFQGSVVTQEPKVAPVTPNRDVLADQIGQRCKALNLSMEGLTEKCMKEFQKSPEDLTADEMQVILMVLNSQFKKGKA